jgi:16S rRNA (guanine(966)-N(2))-methyltransferase RsmD
MRVIGGVYRSRRLPGRVPGGTRPTSDRLRETLFNILGPRVIESVFLDGYAGSGAVGIEAISRGAAFVCFVERSDRAVRAIRANLEALGVESGYRILTMEPEAAFRIFDRESVRFDLVFLDPPYGNPDLPARDLARLGVNRLVNAGGQVVVEHSERSVLPARTGSLRQVRCRDQGSARLSFYESESA